GTRSRLHSRPVLPGNSRAVKEAHTGGTDGSRGEMRPRAEGTTSGGRASALQSGQDLPAGAPARKGDDRGLGGGQEGLGSVDDQGKAPLVPGGLGSHSVPDGQVRGQ